MIDHSIHADLSIAEILRDLVDEGRIVSIWKSDGDYQGDAGIGRYSTSETLEGCLEGLTGNIRTKICIREDCKTRGKPLPLSRFSPDKDSRDGHQSECKSCASKRIGTYGKKKSIAAIAATGHQDKMSETLRKVE
jgi:hypothetical protein